MTPEAAVLLISALALGAIDPRNDPDAKKEEKPPPSAPYSVPWQLRPVVAPTAVRLDTSFAHYEGPNTSGVTTVSVLNGSWRIPGTGPASAGLAPAVRVPFIRDSLSGVDRMAIGNPVIGIAYAIKLAHGFRLNTFMGSSIPVGMGGGDSPNQDALAARTKGSSARAYYDNALFAVNDVALMPGASAAWVHGGLTLQVEATLFELLRVRGATKQAEATKTNFTTGFHVGYFVVPQMSIGSEIRYQRWLNAPFAVDKEDTNRDSMSIAIGPRAHFPIGDALFLRPGVSYQRGLDAPLSGSANVHIVQVDIPLFFM